MAQQSDLDLAEVKQLLASGDHHDRLAVGNVCLIEGSPTPRGVVWVNFAGHVDRYAGRWSRPSSTVAYLNQLFVDPSFRGGGIGVSLVRAAARVAADRGCSEVTALIRPENIASRTTFERAGAHTIGQLIGLRVGRVAATRLRPVARPRRAGK